MVLGDGFIDCFFFTPICLGKMVDEVPETNMFQLNIDLFEDVSFSFWKGLFLRGELPVSFREGNTKVPNHAII